MTPDSKTVTIDTCADEPIHIPGSIQPHGCLLACRLEDAPIVDQASRNLGAFFARDFDACIDQPLLELFEPESAQRLAHAIQSPQRLREANPLRLRTDAQRSVDAVLHANVDGRLIVELEPRDGEAGAGFDPGLRAAVVRMQSARQLAALNELVAEQVRLITGFDRVMVYRFDRDWNGQVVAESRREDLEPFLGLHYPASDIPAQARRLYTINWLRFITDVDYTPVPVAPARATPLDLSHAALRSVSPIHIEYLQNMGVKASMSVSLVIDGELAGLIACHHYAGPRTIPFRTRETVEYLGRTLSWQLQVLELAERAQQRASASQHETALAASVLTSSELLDSLGVDALMALTASAGAAVVLEEGMRRLGDAPSNRALGELAEWLSTRSEDVFVTDHAAADVPVPIGGGIGGVLAVTISRELHEYLLWFRPSNERTVNWAGDPRKLSAPSDSGEPPRLSPRGSFKLWTENVRGRAEPWDAVHIEAASNLRRLLLSGVRRRAAELRDVNQRLLDADRTKDNFIATVSHELRTPLNAISGWTQLLMMPNVSADRARQGLDVIDRNVKLQTQIVDDLLDVSRMVSGKLTLDLDAVDVGQLVAEILDGLEVALTSKGLRVRRVLDPNASAVLGDATRLRQVVSNLLNNAMKFTPKGGSIAVTLRRVQSDIELTVSDTGRGISPELLPLVFDVFRQGDAGMNRRSQGLGIGLAIARKLVELHGGTIAAESQGKDRGATFRVRIPVAPVAPDRPNALRHAAAATPSLVGVHVLLVEDERDARDMVSLLLSDAGAVVTCLGSASEALTLLETQSFSLVISDLGLPEIDGIRFMRMLREREAAGVRVPSIALTAYTRAHDRASVLNAGYDAHVPKPVNASELLAVVQSLIQRVKR